MRFPFAAILVLIAGCTPQIEMTKAGATDADYQRDKKTCEAQASRASRQHQQLSGRQASEAHNRVLLGCMRERGWEQVVR